MHLKNRQNMSSRGNHPNIIQTAMNNTRLVSKCGEKINIRAENALQDLTNVLNRINQKRIMFKAADQLDGSDQAGRNDLQKSNKNDEKGKEDQDEDAELASPNQVPRKQDTFPQSSLSDSDKLRRQILGSIQRESGTLSRLRLENAQLKQLLHENQVVLEFILSKYRKKILARIDEHDAISSNLVDQHQTPQIESLQAANIHLSNRMVQMEQLYDSAVAPKYTKTILDQMERIRALQVQRNNLVDLLNISKHFGSFNIREEDDPRVCMMDDSANGLCSTLKRSTSKTSPST